MEQSEVETLVEELESRVERLRSLYEQYFMGIEKIEPQVPRKDVERRLYVLRRTMIRNTGLRFRFHNALLRYNTYQTYWMRICRQIEEGTYKRDVRRAKDRFKVDVGRPSKKKGKEEEAEAGAPEVHDTEPPASLDFIEEDVDVDVDLDFELPPDSGANPQDLFEELQMKAVLRPQTLPKDMRPTVGPKGPQAPPQATTPPVPSAARAPQPAARLPDGRQAPTQPAAVGAKPAQPAPTAPAVGGVRYVQAGKPRRPSEIPIPGRTVASPSARALPPPTPPPQPTAHPRAPVQAKRRSSVPKLEAARPAPKSAPSPRAAATRPAPPEGSLSDERVRQIYTKYVETKRSLRESTASLTYENLAKSLRDSSDQLKRKHAGKNVDFEVAVKDGKAILRPVVK